MIRGHAFDVVLEISGEYCLDMFWAVSEVEVRPHYAHVDDRASLLDLFDQAVSLKKRTQGIKMCFVRKLSVEAHQDSQFSVFPSSPRECQGFRASFLEPLAPGGHPYWPLDA